MNKSRLAYDQDLPFIRPVLTRLAPWVEAFPFNGHHPDLTLFRKTDIWLLRSVTKLNQDLVQTSPVRAIISATAGMDHIHPKLLQNSQLLMTNTRGTNANAVREYILTLFFLMLHETKKSLSSVQVGVVGCGEIGRPVAKSLATLGAKVLIYDPPLAESHTLPSFPEDIAKNISFIRSLSALEHTDILTFHVPLTHEGRYPTAHMLTPSFFKHLKRKPWLFNTSRSGIYQEHEILQAYQNKSIAAFLLDVWEHEPAPRQELLQKAAIATPHIAGYSLDASLRTASQMSMTLESILMKNDVTFKSPPPLSLNETYAIRPIAVATDTPDFHHYHEAQAAHSIDTDVMAMVSAFCLKTTGIADLSIKLKAAALSDFPNGAGTAYAPLSSYQDIFKSLRKQARGRREWRNIAPLFKAPLATSPRNPLAGTMPEEYSTLLATKTLSLLKKCGFHIA